MMKKLPLVLICAGYALFSANTFAASNNLNPWKDCGIGAMIFEEHKVAAAVSNVIWDLGTTAISSKLSSEDACAGRNIEAAKFIQDNYHKVLEETSQGSGEHLNAMLDILDVKKENQQNVLKSIRANVGMDIASNTITPESFYNVVMKNI